MPDNIPVRKAPGKADPPDSAVRIEDMSPSGDEDVITGLLDPTPVEATAAAPVETQEHILIHVLRDGFTANGRVWYRGQELEFLPGSMAHNDTKNRYGESWLDFTPAEQMARYGDVMFALGPWPGSAYDNDQAAEAERKRGRMAPTIVPVAGPQRSTR